MNGQNCLYTKSDHSNLSSRALTRLQSPSQVRHGKPHTGQCQEEDTCGLLLKIKSSPNLIQGVCLFACLFKVSKPQAPNCHWLIQNSAEILTGETRCRTHVRLRWQGRCSPLHHSVVHLGTSNPFLRWAEARTSPSLSVSAPHGQ